MYDRIKFSHRKLILVNEFWACSRRESIFGQDRMTFDAEISQSPNSKSDLQNCLNYVKNQCGNHTLNQMAELLNCRLL